MGGIVIHPACVVIVRCVYNSVQYRGAKLGKIQGGGGVTEITKIEATTWVKF